MKTPTVTIKTNELVHDKWFKLRKVSFDYRRASGSVESQTREVADRGNGATILLYHPGQKTVILTRQFRMPTFLNGNPSGMLIETCAGMLDLDGPEECIRRETEEETGYQLSGVRKVFEAYMSPGGITELLHFFVAEYAQGMKVAEGGGLAAEHEDIEVLELPFDKACAMIASGEIRDAKTIMLLQYAKINGLV